MRFSPRRSTVVRAVALVGALAAIVAFLGAVWPTPWRYATTPQALVRINRWSGEVQSLCSDGWRSLTRDPFVDLGENTPQPPMCYWSIPPRKDLRLSR